MWQAVPTTGDSHRASTTQTSPTSTQSHRKKHGRKKKRPRERHPRRKDNDLADKDTDQQRTGTENCSSPHSSGSQCSTVFMATTDSASDSMETLVPVTAESGAPTLLEATTSASSPDGATPPDEGCSCTPVYICTFFALSFSWFYISVDL